MSVSLAGPSGPAPPPSGSSPGAAWLAAMAAGLLLLAAWAALRGRGAPAAPLVRDAGTEAMRDPPPDWDLLDEQLDETFPASDPPGNY